MDGLEKRVKDHPLVAGMVIILPGMLIGTAVGLLFGYEAERSITEGARASNPNDPLDMLPLVVFGYIVLGFCGGTLAGLLVAGIVYFTNRQRGVRSLTSS
jgi:hypothetical protein